MMPILQAKLGLESVVVRGADALDLIDVAVLRIKLVVGTQRLIRSLVEIEQAQQTATFAANVSDLREDAGGEGVLHVDAVVLVVSGAEVVVDREDAASGGGGAGIALRRWEDCDVLLDGALCACDWSHSVDGAGTAGISFHTVGCSVAGAIVEEGVEVRSIEIEAETYADNGARGSLIACSKAWAEALVVALVDAVDLIALEGKSV